MRRLLILVLPCFLGTAAFAAPITIDNFESGDMTIVNTTGSGPATASASGPASDILGGVRDASSEVQTGPPAIATFRVGLFPGEATLENGAFTQTEVILTYNDNGPHDLLIDEGGLIGTESSTFVTFDFVQALDLTITATATDSDGDIASTTLSGVGAGITSTDLFVDWTPDGGNTGSVNFDSTTSFVASILAVDGSDWRLNNISVESTLPEPTSALITGLLLFGLAYRRRRN